MVGITRPDRTMPIAFDVGEVQTDKQKEFLIIPQFECLITRLQLWRARVMTEEERQIAAVLDDLVEGETGVRPGSAGTIPAWASSSWSVWRAPMMSLGAHARAFAAELEVQLGEYRQRHWKPAEQVVVLRVQIGVLDALLSEIPIESMHEPLVTFEWRVHVGEQVRTMLQNRGPPGEFRGIWFTRGW